MITYSISYNNPLRHIIDIKMKIDNVSEDLLHLSLPAWRPGRYEIANYAKNVLNIVATDHNGNTLAIRKVKKSEWEVMSGNSSEVTVEYSYYAFQMDAGNSWLDEEQLYINFINCMLYSPERMDEPCEVLLELPENYEIACGLNEKKKHSLYAQDYYQLVDSPMITSAKLKHLSYSVDQYKFHIWIQGDCSIDDDKMIKDFEKFTRCQINTIGEFPCEEYHFLIQALPYRHYHGVEHGNSTVITLGSENGLDESRYEALLGVSSHELFHTWNALRIRPKELLPYNFSRESYFDTGYVIEGITTYYGDLFLARGSVLSKKWYINELNQSLKRYYENFGRQNMSLADSSRDLWLDGYVTGVPNRKVSIYNEGALVAWMIDLRVRIETDHQKSLDDLMRLLWEKREKTNQGYDSCDIKKSLNKVVRYDWESFFEKFIYGIESYTDELQKLLPHFGLELEEQFPEKSHERSWGVRVNEENVVVKIVPSSPAESVLSLNDKIEKLGEISDSEDESVLLEITRDHKSKEVHIEKTSNEYFSYWHIKKSDSTDSSYVDAYNKWLNL